MAQVTMDEMSMFVGRMDHMAQVVDAYGYPALQVLLNCKPEVAHTICYSFDSFSQRRLLMNRVARLRVMKKSNGLRSD